MLKTRKIALIGWLLWSLILAGCLPTVSSDAGQTPARIVAIGDVHGSFDGLKQILKEAALIDDQNKWIGKKAILVQTGDILDRGPDVKKVMDLLMELQREAPKDGGEVIVLLGNHETMNISRFVRDVSPQAIASFEPSGETEAKEEYMQALGPKGVYGKWLRTLPLTAVVGDTLFIHGGISPEIDNMSVRRLNKKAKEEIDTFDRGFDFLETNNFISPLTTLKSLGSDVESAIGSSDLPEDTVRKAAVVTNELLRISNEGLLFRKNGPLWFRGFAEWKDDKLQGYLPKYLESQRVERIVSGHSPQEKGLVKARLDDKIFLIDTGMLSSFYAGGGPAALEIDHDHITAIYPSKREILVHSHTHSANRQAPAHGWSKRLWLDPDGNPLPFTNNQEAIEFLQTASVIDEKDIPLGITRPKKLLLQKGDVKAHAVFRYYHKPDGEIHASSGLKNRNFRDSYLNEVAAYELNLLLGMGTLPPTTIRTVRGVSGSLQLWVEETMTDADRITKKINPPNVPHWKRQFWDINVFDNLVNNSDRNNGNVLIDDQWRVWLIDHTRSFGKDTSLPSENEVVRCSRQLWKALIELDPKAVRKKLRPHLEADELNAFFSRHKRIMVHLRRLMEKHGSHKVLFDHQTCCGA